MNDSPGQAALREITRPPQYTIADIARALGVTPQAVGQWLSGRSRPSPEHRKALAKRYKIRGPWGDE